MDSKQLYCDSLNMRRNACEWDFGGTTGGDSPNSRSLSSAGSAFNYFKKTIWSVNACGTSSLPEGGRASPNLLSDRDFSELSTQVLKPSTGVNTTGDRALFHNPGRSATLAKFENTHNLKETTLPNREEAMRNSHAKRAPCDYRRHNMGGSSPSNAMTSKSSHSHFTKPFIYQNTNRQSEHGPSQLNIEKRSRSVAPQFITIPTNNVPYGSQAMYTSNMTSRQPATVPDVRGRPTWQSADQHSKTTYAGSNYPTPNYGQPPHLPPTANEQQALPTAYAHYMPYYQICNYGTVPMYSHPFAGAALYTPAMPQIPTVPKLISSVLAEQTKNKHIQRPNPNRSTQRSVKNNPKNQTNSTRSDLQKQFNMSSDTVSNNEVFRVFDAFNRLARYMMWTDHPNNKTEVGQSRQILGNLSITKQVRYAIWNATAIQMELHRTLELYKPVAYRFQGVYLECQLTLRSLYETIAKLDKFRDCRLYHIKGKFVSHTQRNKFVWPLIHTLEELGQRLNQSQVAVMTFEEGVNIIAGTYQPPHERRPYYNPMNQRYIG